MKSKGSFFFFTILFACAIFFTLALPAASSGEDPLLFVAKDDDAPYSFYADGSPSGYASDLLRILSATIGRDIEIRLMPLKQCLEEVKAGRADGLIGAIKDEDLEAFLDYSIPIGNFEFNIFIEAGTRYVSSLKSLEGTVVGISEGCFIKKYLEKNERITYVRTKDLSGAFKKLKDREITAVITERHAALYYIQTKGITDLEIVGPPVGPALPYFIAVKKDNTELLGDIDRGIETLKENETLRKLQRKWLGLRLEVTFPWKMVILATSGITLTVLILAGILWVVSLNATVKMKTEQIHVMSRKMVEKDKLAVLGKLAGQIAHELRTPLSIINNSVYLLRKEGSKNRELFEKRLHVLEDKIKLASNILESILSYSRVKAEVASEVTVSECVEEVLKDIEIPKTIKKEITFEDRSISVFMDFHQLYSVVRNIVLNAVQAMQAEGKLTINVFLSDKGSIVNIRICDTGKGIIENARNKIFNLFYSTKIMGTGLGLPISKSIIEASQGELHLEETSEKGTCFIISLPSAKTSKETAKG